MTKALWINAANRTVTVVDVMNLEDMQARVGGLIEIAWGWDSGDTLFVDEEGLFKPQAHFFRLADRGDSPMAGNGLVVGTDEDGESVDVKLTADDLAARLHFYTREQVDAWAKGNASEPAVSITFGGTTEVVSRIGSLYAQVPRPKNS